MSPTRAPARGLAVAAALLGGLPATAYATATPAAMSDQLRRHGHCSGAADWQLEARTADGRIEVRGEVDTRSAGQRWRWRILHDGGVSARGRATTDGGGFDVRRLVVNAPGPDRIGWRARNVSSGQRCRGNLTI